MLHVPCPRGTRGCGCEWAGAPDTSPPSRTVSFDTRTMSIRGDNLTNQIGSQSQQNCTVHVPFDTKLDSRVSRLASYLGPPYTKTPNGLAQRVDETPNEPKPRGSAVRLASRQAHGADARGVRGTRGYRGPSRLNNTPHRMAHRAGGTISKATPPCPPTAKCQPSWLWCWVRARVSASRPARTLS